MPEAEGRRDAPSHAATPAAALRLPFRERRYAAAYSRRMRQRGERAGVAQPAEAFPPFFVCCVQSRHAAFAATAAPYGVWYMPMLIFSSRLRVHILRNSAGERYVSDC